MTQLRRVLNPSPPTPVPATMEIGGLQLECSVCRYDLFHPRRVALPRDRWDRSAFFGVSAIACDRCGAIQLFDPSARSHPGAPIPARRARHIRRRPEQSETSWIDDPARASDCVPFDQDDESAGAQAVPASDDALADGDGWLVGTDEGWLFETAPDGSGAFHHGSATLVPDATPVEDAPPLEPRSGQRADDGLSRGDDADATQLWPNPLPPLPPLPPLAAPVDPTGPQGPPSAATDCPGS